MNRLDLQTAVIFIALVILMDFFVVALLIERSLAMFSSFLGTWLPFVLIFSAAYLGGHYLEGRAGAARAA